MAIDYAPVGPFEDEEELQRGGYAYPPAVPAPADTSPATQTMPAVGSTEDLESRGLANRVAPPAGPGSTEDLEARSLATHVAPPSTPAPARPTWDQYAPPQLHGFRAFGAALAGPKFAQDRQSLAQQRYQAAMSDYEAPLREADMEAQAEQRRGAPALAVQEKKNEGAMDVQGEKGKTAEQIEKERTESTEKIAKERTESSERVAQGHDLVRGEVARIQAAAKAAAAKDPNALTNTMKTMKQQAQSTLPGIDRALDETEKVAGQLGPAEGRWNDFWQGKVGMADPQFAHYKDEIAMVSSAVTLAHARGRMSNELFEHFNKMFDAGKQAPANMIQALNVAKEWLGEYATMGETPAAAGAGQGGGATPGAFATWKAKQPK
jgi:hypothetical protein